MGTSGVRLLVHTVKIQHGLIYFYFFTFFSINTPTRSLVPDSKFQFLFLARGSVHLPPRTLIPHSA